MRPILPALLAVLVGAASADAGLVRETWGRKAVHPDTLSVIVEGEAVRIVFDLSAIPKGAAVRRALLRNEKIRQPARPIRIFAVAKLKGDAGPAVAGRPLALVPPRHQWFDATDAVRRWVSRPESNLGLSLASAAGFPPEGAFLDVWYEGRPKPPPPSVTGLKAIHHDGQTFLTWEELPMYRPEPSEVVWATYDKRPVHVVDGPGEGYMGKPRVAGIRQKTFRKLQRYKVINPTTRSMSRQRPRLVRIGPWPDVRYRVYRSRKKITPENVHQAEWLGDARPLCGYDRSKLRFRTWGEYYDPREDPEAFVPTYCLEDGRSIPPGRAFHVHTPQEQGQAYYAVTVARDGVESFAVVTGRCSLAQPVAEKNSPLRPVLQYPRTFWAAVRYEYYLWQAPPLANSASQKINRVMVYTAHKHKPPGWLTVIRYAPPRVHNAGNVMLCMDYGNGIGYSQGRGTFLSYAEAKVDYYHERACSRMIDWVCQEWKIDRGRGIGAEGQYLPPLYAVRNPDRIRYLHTQASGLGYDWIWRPRRCRLRSLLGPRASATTVDGTPAWNLWHLGWYLKRNPARDLPFFYWKERQEGPEVSFLAIGALRDARQPFACEWGGGRLSRQLRHMLRVMRWDRSVPAFGNCSLDANPGSGWRPDGDPRGQINGYLVWDYHTVVETAGRWEMTAGLTLDAPRDECAVDVTPRHCRLFKRKPGQKFLWTNTDQQGRRGAQSGEVTADPWGLVTLRDVKLLKGIPDQGLSKPRNRIRIVRKN